MIRTSILFLFLLGSLSSNAQLFHFNTNTTTLIKSVDQSPAHWYIEIIADGTIDTTLRWKAHFDGVPPEWEISFDDQSNYYMDLLDTDSADFTLYQGLSFPQKLIIGAMFNNFATNATVSFDIYDPENPTVKETISYIFIVNAVGLEELAQNKIIDFSQGKFIVLNDIPTYFQQVDETGRVITEAINVKEFELKKELIGLNFIVIRQNDKVYSIKWMQ